MLVGLQLFYQEAFKRFPPLPRLMAETESTANFENLIWTNPFFDMS